MPYRFRQHESASTALRRVAAEEMDRALSFLQSEKRSTEFRVHEARKACKKIRSLLRLAQRPLKAESIFKKENRWFRDTARELARLRDADATRECIRRLQRSDAADAPSRAALAALRVALGRGKPTSSAQSETRAALQRAAERFMTAHSRLDRWPNDHDAGFEYFQDGFRKCYRKARKAMQRAAAKPTVEHMHEWRKRVKDHRYHQQLLRGPWKFLDRTGTTESKQLTDALGEHHDLAVLRTVPSLETLKANHRAHLHRLIDQESARLESRAIELGQQLFDINSKRLTGKLKRAWMRWQRVGTASTNA